MGGRLDKQTALVFGGGTTAGGIGNGKAAAILMAREGAAIMVADIDLAAAAETCRVIEQGRRMRVAHSPAMWKQPADIAAVVRTPVAASLCGIDVLLYNVGVGAGGLGLFGP